MDGIGKADSRLMLIVSTVLFLVLYLLPAIIALGRGHPKADSILILNTVLGWTVVGWLIALVWSTRSTASRGRLAL